MDVAGLKGSDVNKAAGMLRIKGKYGKVRYVELPADLAIQLNESRGFLFTPNQAWKSLLFQVVRQTTGELGIKISSLHHLSSNYAQGIYLDLKAQGRILGEISQSLEAGPF